MSDDDALQCLDGFRQKYVDMVSDINNNAGPTTITNDDFHNILIAADSLNLDMEAPFFANFADLYLVSEIIILDCVGSNGRFMFVFDGLVSNDTYFKLLRGILSQFNLDVEIEGISGLVVKHEGVVHIRQIIGSSFDVQKLTIGYMFGASNQIYNLGPLKKLWKLFVWLIRNMRISSIVVHNALLADDAFRELSKIPLIELKMLYNQGNIIADLELYIELLVEQGSVLKHTLRRLEISSKNQTNGTGNLGHHCVSKLMKLQLTHLSIDEHIVSVNDFSRLFGQQRAMLLDVCRNPLHIGECALLYPYRCSGPKQQKNVNGNCSLADTLESLQISDRHLGSYHLDTLSGLSLKALEITGYTYMNNDMADVLISTLFCKNSNLAMSIRTLTLSCALLTEDSIKTINMLSVSELTLRMCIIDGSVAIAPPTSPLSKSLLILDLHGSNVSKIQLDFIFMLAELEHLCLSGIRYGPNILKKFRIAEKPIRNKLRTLKYTFSTLSIEDISEISMFELRELDLSFCDIRLGYLVPLGSDISKLKLSLKVFKCDHNASIGLFDIESISKIALEELDISCCDTAIANGCLKYLARPSVISSSLKKLDCILSKSIFSHPFEEYCMDCDYVAALSQIGLVHLAISGPNIEFIDKIKPLMMEDKEIKKTLKSLRIVLFKKPDNPIVLHKLFPGVNIQF